MALLYLDQNTQNKMYNTAKTTTYLSTVVLLMMGCSDSTDPLEASNNTTETDAGVEDNDTGVTEDAPPSGPLDCALDLPQEACESAGCTFLTTQRIIDHTDQTLPEACEVIEESSEVCLPITGEGQGEIVTYFQRDLPNGDKEMILLPEDYDPTVIEGWTGCGEYPESGYVDCRCSPGYVP